MLIIIIILNGNKNSIDIVDEKDNFTERQILKIVRRKDSKTENNLYDVSENHRVCAMSGSKNAKKKE